MFVRQSKYDAAIRALVDTLAKQRAAEKAYAALLKEWNELVQKINDKGGPAFMASSLKDNVRDSLGLTSEDVTKLLMLCHPDKHNGKPMAQDMTVKLLELKKRVKA